jgi:hypothetical protein
MRFPVRTLALGVLIVLSLGAIPAAAAPLLLNGGFEGGFTGWTIVDEPGGSGSWFPQTGTASPLNAFMVPAPPEGLTAAMTDQGGPGSHILYQDFVVPAAVANATLSLQLFIHNYADDFIIGPSLSYLDPNQQARIDITTTTADPFSLAAPGDVLLNLYQTQPGDPLVSGYALHSFDLTVLLAAHVGETLRLRFAEVDNQLFFNMGVDAVSLDAVNEVPEPASLWLFAAAAAGAWARRVISSLRRFSRAAWMTSPLVGPGAEPVPEPVTLALLGLGVAAGARRQWRRRSVRQ